jgi:hypothetical protein
LRGLLWVVQWIAANNDVVFGELTAWRWDYIITGLILWVIASAWVYTKCYGKS